MFWEAPHPVLKFQVRSYDWIREQKWGSDDCRMDEEERPFLSRVAQLELIANTNPEIFLMEKHCVEYIEITPPPPPQIANISWRKELEWLLPLFYKWRTVIQAGVLPLGSGCVTDRDIDNPVDSRQPGPSILPFSLNIPPNKDSIPPSFLLWEWCEDLFITAIKGFKTLVWRWDWKKDKVRNTI